jgi:ComF family protein
MGEVLFPLRCLACGVLFRRSGADAAGGEDEAGAPAGAATGKVLGHACGRLLCSGCLKNIRPAASPLCPVCGVVYESRHGDDHLCGECLAFPKHFDAARAFGVYDSALMSLIHHFKYRGRPRLAVGLGQLLAAAYMDHYDHRPPDLVAPVPLHPRRLRKRGFNQAYLLAGQLLRRVASEAGADASPRLERELLRRRRATPPQTGLGRRQRWVNIRNAFEVGDSASVRQRRVLLVDDVLTTGATANECARVLKAAGADRVDILTLARGV